MTRQNAVVAGGSVTSDSDENAADTGPVRDLFGAAVSTSGSTAVNADNSPASVARDESGCESETGVTTEVTTETATEAKTGSNVKPGGKSDTYVEVAVPSPLHRTFDYIWPFADRAFRASISNSICSQRQVHHRSTCRQAQTCDPLSGV